MKKLFIRVEIVAYQVKDWKKLGINYETVKQNNLINLTFLYWILMI